MDWDFLPKQVLHGHERGRKRPAELFLQSVQLLINIDNIHFSQECYMFIQKNNANSDSKIWILIGWWKYCKTHLSLQCFLCPFAFFVK